MKKYLPISAVLLAFFSLVFLRNFKPSDEENQVGLNNPQPTPVDSLTPLPTSITPTTVGNKPTPTPPVTISTGKYKDGTFTGTVEDAYYGNYQIAAVISGGKISDINFLEYPNDNRTSRSINTQAMVYLKAEAIAAQSAQVDIVSGASSSSEAFSRSLASALKRAVR
jgi:uncharacterized protein with FMN-binding domain